MLKISLSFSFNDDDFNLQEFNDGAFITSRPMKKLIFILCLFNPVLIAAQDEAERAIEVTYTFDASDFIFIPSDYADAVRVYWQTNFLRYYWPGRFDVPSLPLCDFDIPLGTGNHVVSVDVESKEELIQEDILIAPQPTAVPTTGGEDNAEAGEKAIEYDADIYYESPIIDMSTRKYTYPQAQNKEPINDLQVVLCPMKYYSRNHQLFILKEITLKIKVAADTDGVPMPSSPIVNRKQAMRHFFDLSGRQIGNGQWTMDNVPRGVYVRDGKKVAVRRSR